MKKLFEKKVLSWAMYDSANSVFFTTVMAGFFPIFFKKYWSSGVESFVTTERLGWILAISGFLLAIISPFLGALSDKKNIKKKLLFIFMCIGVTSTLSLAFVPEGHWTLAAVLYGVALFSCTASTVFYDSLITSVALPENYDRVSSWGYSLGYLFGGLVFAFNVFMYLKPDFFGLKSSVDAVLVSFLIVGLWWFVFTLPLMFYVPEHENKTSQSLITLLKTSTSEVLSTFKDISKQKNLFLFLLSYWFFIDGVSTVMSMAVDFGVSLNLETADLIKALLITQFVGFPSAYLAGEVASRWNAKAVILISLVVYIVVVLGASMMSTANEFYIMAMLIGLAQGAIQALSRSLFAQLIPVHKSGEYFGFFNLIGKFASVLGPILMATTARIFQDNKMSILSLLILFILGGYFLIQVKIVSSKKS